MSQTLSKLYRKAQMDSAPSVKQVEISILDMASGRLRGCLGSWGAEHGPDLDEALRFNQKMWDVFASEWSNPDSHLPKEIREQLLSLAVFVKKKTFATIVTPERANVETLVRLNETLLSGLKGETSE